MKNMIRILAITCCVLLALAPAAALAGSNTAGNAKAFSPEDLTVDNVSLGATQTDVGDAFREQHGSGTETSGLTGQTVTTWYYGGDMTLTFNGEEQLIGAVVTDDKHTGPRGLKVGMTVREVIALFLVDPSSGTSSVPYTSGFSDRYQMQIPPCGYVERHEDGTISVVYLAPMTPYGDDVKNDPDSFIQKDHAQLLINFDKDGKVTSYSLGQGPLGF